MNASHTTLILTSPATIDFAGVRYPCRIGRGGIAPANEKREGDLKTPTGRFALRSCYYRPDRISPPPQTILPRIPLTPSLGWCDDPAHAMYNQPVTLPFDGRHELLWREDNVYDLIIPLGYNDGIDAPIIAGAGSAIFMHVMREDGVGTEGCIALKRDDLMAVLMGIGASTHLEISAC
jgi:L,D-peptidoglycan transpeptidase YkuD (ErfK/YbiS/YcfS/YnhG family)